MESHISRKTSEIWGTQGLWSGQIQAGKSLWPRARVVAHWSESIGRIRFRPTVPDFLHGAPPTGACAAFIKESRMKLYMGPKVC